MTKERQKIISITKDDFDVQAIRAGGPGGQKQNKTSSAIRMTHRASGASAVARDERSQKANMKAAFSRVIETKEFKTWLKMEICRKDGTLRDIENSVDAMLKESNIRTDIMQDGKWKEAKVTELDVEGEE